MGARVSAKNRGTSPNGGNGAPRAAFDHYATPDDLCLAALRTLGGKFHSAAAFTVLDVGAGGGAWGRAARQLWPNAHITGIEIQPRFERPPEYDRWLTANFMTAALGPYDLVTGNPPFGDEWDETQKRLKKVYAARGEVYLKPPRPADLPVADAEAFIRRGAEAGKRFGAMLYLLRLAMLEGQDRGQGLWKTHRPQRVWVLSRRPSFTPGGGTDSAAYGLYLWDRTISGPGPLLDWLEW